MATDSLEVLAKYTAKLVARTSDPERYLRSMLADARRDRRHRVTIAYQRALALLPQVIDAQNHYDASLLTERLDV